VEILLVLAVLVVFVFGLGKDYFMHYAIIENGIVINVAVAEEPLESNWIATEAGAIGDIYENGQFTKPEPIQDPLAYQKQRMMEYPSPLDYLDGVVKGDQAQIDAYIAACLAVKAKYPKPA